MSEHIDLTYQKNLDEMMDQRSDSMDAQITHIKGDGIWALGPKAKHEILRVNGTKNSKTSVHKNY